MINSSEHLQELVLRAAASGLLPRRYFTRTFPRPSELPRRTGRLKLEIVSHCWNYSHLLAYQLTSLVRFPPTKLSVVMTVFHNEEDKRTVELLRFFGARAVPNVTWDWWPLEKDRLFQRAIGRNLACLTTRADWIWLTDCDQVFHRGCLDTLADQLQGRNDMLVFPRVACCTPLLEEQHPMLQSASAEPALVDIEPSQFKPVTHKRAIGACQIVHGDVARLMGYCRDIPYYQRPIDNWKCTIEDRTFRWLLGTRGEPLDVPGLFRIEHRRKGRDEVAEDAGVMRRGRQFLRLTLRSWRKRAAPSLPSPDPGPQLQLTSPQPPVPNRTQPMNTTCDHSLRRHLVEHLVRTVNRAPVVTEPFPHFLIQGFFPADVYERLLASLPSPDAYEAFDYDKHQQNGQSNRRRFQMTNAWLDRLHGEARTFWYAVRGALGSTELKRAVFDKLAPGLSFRYSVGAERTKDLPGFALPELFHETQGYSIKPHPDTRKKVVTMQIALARDASQEGLGTEFYRRSTNPLAWLREPRGFEIVKRMPFLPNTAYAFSVLNTFTLKSWHGRTAIAGECGERNSLLNIWYEKAEHANADLVAETRMRSAA